VKKKKWKLEALQITCTFTAKLCRTPISSLVQVANRVQVKDGHFRISLYKLAEDPSIKEIEAVFAKFTGTTKAQRLPSAPAHANPFWFCMKRTGLNRDFLIPDAGCGMSCLVW